MKKIRTNVHFLLLYPYSWADAHPAVAVPSSEEEQLHIAQAGPVSVPPGMLSTGTTQS